MKLLHALSCATFPSTKTNQRKEKNKNRHIQKQQNHVLHIRKTLTNIYNKKIRPSKHGSVS